MHRLKLIDLSRISARHWFSEDQYNRLKLPCKEAAYNFDVSVRRVNGLRVALGHAFLCGEQWMSATYAVHKGRPDLVQGTPDFTLACLAAFTEISKPISKEDYFADFDKSTHNVDEHFFQMEAVYNGFEALVQSVIIQAWIAFEVLLEDLLSGTVKAYPVLFPNITHDKLRLRALNRDKGTRYWYKKCVQGDGLIVALVNNDAISALAELRHVLVHKAGKVDKDFREAAEKIPLLDRFAHLPDKSLIEFDGKMASFYVDLAFAKAYAIISALDGWISRHSPPPTTP